MAMFRVFRDGLVGLLFLLAAGVARADIQLDFGLYAADSPETVKRQFRLLLDGLESAMTQRLGQPVRIRLNLAATYEEALTNLRTGKVGFARLGGATYVFAKQAQPDLRLLAMETKGGEKMYYGAIVVRADSPLQRIEDLKGKTIAFPDERSTIGRYLSQHLLLRNGITARDLGAYAYLGRHDLVGEAVAEGRFDAGALRQGTIKRMTAKGHRLHPLAIFRTLTRPWVAHRALPEHVYLALRESLLSLRDAQIFSELAADDTDGFAPAEDADFDPMRVAIQRNAEFFR